MKAQGVDFFSLLCYTKPMDEKETIAPPKASPWKKTGRRVLAVFALLILFLVALFFITGTNLSAVGRVFTYRSLGSAAHADVFSLNAMGADFALVGDGLSVASSAGLTHYNRAGVPVFFEPFAQSSPQIQESGGRTLTYDLGGTSLQVATADAPLRFLEWESNIYHASLNENGWVTVSAEQMGARGMVTVLNGDGNPVFRLRLTTGHLVGAVLGNDNRTLVVSTLTPAGGQLAWYAIDQETDTPMHTFLSEDEVFFAHHFTSGNNLAAISSEHVHFFSQSGQVLHTFPFDGKTLQAFDFDGGNMLLYLSATIYSSQGELVRMSSAGRVETIALDGQVRDIALSGNFAAVLMFDRLELLRNMEPYRIWEDTEGMHRVLLRPDGAVFRLGDSRARLLVP